MSEARFEHFFQELTAWSAGVAPSRELQQEPTGETCAIRREALVAKVRSHLGREDTMAEGRPGGNDDDLDDEVFELADTSSGRS